jgi:hypothetical protein
MKLDRNVLRIVLTSLSRMKTNPQKIGLLLTCRPYNPVKGNGLVSNRSQWNLLEIPFHNLLQKVTGWVVRLIKARQEKTVRKYS